MAESNRSVDLAIAIPTLVGSLLSSLGTSFIIATYIFIPPKPNHIRHTLICNLAVAEFGLHFGNSVSGLMIVARGKDLEEGSGCVASGFLTQLCVQAVDFSMLVISVFLFYIVTHRLILRKPPLWITCSLIAVSWTVPVITSFTALANQYYHPVSGNWCWIQAKPRYLRYVLTHLWRFLIIILVVSIGFRMRSYMRRRQDNLDNSVIEQIPLQSKVNDGPFHAEWILEDSTAEALEDNAMTISEKRKVLLLSGYPIFYVVLWLPGIANRIAEATGHGIRGLKIMQATTAYIGLANAATFGWNEVRDQFSIHKVLEMTLGFMLGN